MNADVLYDRKDPEWAQIGRSMPKEEELEWLIQESGLFMLGGAIKLTVQMQDGNLCISSLWGGPEIGFPHNCNTYKLPHTKHVERRTAEWIINEWEHLCWTDFHYIPPREYNGDNPQTLDELCVYYKNLRSLEKDLIVSNSFFSSFNFHHNILIELIASFFSGGRMKKPNNGTTFKGFP